jgi:short-subunit dehydrogenase
LVAPTCGNTSAHTTLEIDMNIAAVGHEEADPTRQPANAALLLMLLFIALLLSGCASTRTTNAGRVVVVAGASSGFGKGVALQLADQGATLVLAARRTQLLEELAQQCRQRGGNAVVVTADVSSESDVRRITEAAVGQFGRIDVWINMAGVGALGRFEDIPLADHHRVVEINLNGVINGSHYALRQFRKQQAGTLINIASVAGRVPFPYYPSYVATKHAVVGLGAAINQELRANREKNIHIATISPYAADTPWFDHAANYTGHKPRQILLDPPEKVIRAIVAATVDPRPEINVGYKAKMAVASHRFTHRLTEAMTAAMIHKVQIEDSPPAPSTAGSLYEPMLSGQTVDGGVRQRLKEGDLQKIDDQASGD